MEQEKPTTLSLIIPVYNVSKYIERCLKSVLNQTYDHFECILVDDASPDDSIAKSERMIKDYVGSIQFRILHHAQNRGLSAARNTGIDAATGDYILFLDSDDLISNDCVEKLMAPVRNDRSIEMVVGEHLRFSDDGLLDRKTMVWRHQEDLTSQESIRNLYFDRQYHIPPAAWNKLTSRDFINKHHLRFKEGQIWEDTLWFFFEMKHLRHIYIIPDVTYYYYYRPDSISYGTNAEEKNKQWCLLFDTLSANFTPGEESREAALHLDRFCYGYIRTPKCKEFRAVAKRFARALPFRQYPAQRVLLAAASLLPHNDTGKQIFKWINNQFK